MSHTAVDPGPRSRRWTRDEYHRAAEAGIFGPDERLELIEGEVLENVSPVGSPHRVAVSRTFHVLEAAFRVGFYVEMQAPITLSDGSEPQPDVLVAAGSLDDYEDRHPSATDTVLVVEVSDSTLAFDRGRKMMVYASAGVAEYWIINLAGRRLEVYREPSSTFGYRTVTEFGPDDSVAPLAAPHSSIDVAKLLPRKA